MSICCIIGVREKEEGGALHQGIGIWAEEWWCVELIHLQVVHTLLQQRQAPGAHHVVFFCFRHIVPASKFKAPAPMHTLPCKGDRGSQFFPLSVICPLWHPTIHYNAMGEPCYSSKMERLFFLVGSHSQTKRMQSSGSWCVMCTLQEDQALVNFPMSRRTLLQPKSHGRATQQPRHYKHKA